MLLTLTETIPLKTRYRPKLTFCGTWCLPHSQIHNDRAVPIITVILHIFIAHARNGHISTSGFTFDVSIVFHVPQPRFSIITHGNFGDSAIK